MKKACLIFILSLISSYTFAQEVEVGIQFSPTISISRLEEEITAGTYDTDLAFKFSAGPVVDFKLGDNVALSSGLFFASKGVRYSATIAATDNSQAVDANFDVDLQYIQLPIGLKLSTGEIATGLKIYFEIGGILDTKIDEKYDTKTEYNKGLENELTSETIEPTFAKLFDAEMHFGIGTELEIGSNAAYIGFTYNRGLVDVLHKDFHKLTVDYDPNASDDAKSEKRKKLSINSDTFGIVFGFKF